MTTRIEIKERHGAIQEVTVNGRQYGSAQVPLATLHALQSLACDLHELAVSLRPEPEVNRH